MTKIKFEIKFFITVLLLLGIGLSMINLIFIKTFKIYVEETLAREIALYQTIIEKGIALKLPDYLKVSREDFLDKNYTLFEMKKDKFFFVKSDHIRDIIGDKVKLLLYWDFIILLSVVLLYYLTLYRMMERNNSYLKTFETILMVFSHKLGNYLSIARINTELLKSGNMNAIQRLENSNTYLEKDLNDIKGFVSRVNISGDLVKEIDFGDIVSKTIDELGIKDSKSVKIHLKKIHFTSVLDDISFGVYLVLDNAKKYSFSQIHVRTGIFNGIKYFIIRNNISKDEKSGLGVGLEVSSKLFGKNGHKLTWHSGKNFSVRVVFKDRLKIF